LGLAHLQILGAALAGLRRGARLRRSFGRFGTAPFEAGGGAFGIGSRLLRLRCRSLACPQRTGGFALALPFGPALLAARCARGGRAQISASLGARIAEGAKRAFDAGRLELLDETAALEPLRVARIRRSAEQRRDD